MSARRKAATALIALLVVALSCPAAWAGHGSSDHWSDGSGNQAQVTHVDSTGSAWPVQAKSARWDDLNTVDVYYASPGNCSTHCVSVDAIDGLGPCTGSTILYGYTADGLTSSGHMTGDRRVRFNVHCNGALSDPARGEVACHEFGHSVGRLIDGRSHDAGSCMRTGEVDSPLQIYPDNHDQNVLEGMYAHND